MEGKLQFTLAKLPQWMSANSGHFALISNWSAGKSDRDESRKVLATSIAEVGSAIQMVAAGSAERNISSFQDKLLEVELQLLEEADPSSPKSCLLQKRKRTLEALIESANKRLK